MFKGRDSKTSWVMVLDSAYGVIAHRELRPHREGEPSDDMVAILRGIESKLVILAHQHIDRGPEPSQGDIELTRYVQKVVAGAGAEVLDHIVLGADRFYSMSREGTLAPACPGGSSEA